MINNMKETLLSLFGLKVIIKVILICVCNYEHISLIKILIPLVPFNFVEKQFIPRT